MAPLNDSTGHTKYFLGGQIDVTESLKDSQNLLELIVDSSESAKKESNGEGIRSHHDVSQSMPWTLCLGKRSKTKKKHTDVTLEQILPVNLMPDQINATANMRTDLEDFYSTYSHVCQS
jgi:hypothetical protein